MKIQPLGDRVLVQPLEDAETVKGGIIIPDTAKEKPQQGKVIALGTGKGDTVLMPKYGGTELKIDDKDYQIMREDDILGVVS